MLRHFHIVISVMFFVACGRQDGLSLVKEFETSKDAKDLVFLVTGGGYSPFGSQVVLETNMKLFDEVAETFEVSQVTRLFGGGNDQKIQDVIAQDDSFSVEDKLFANLFAGNHKADCKLRHNELTNLDGNSRKETLTTWMDVAAEELEKNDRFRFYYTGHGAHEDDRYDVNFLALWQSDYSVQEFTEQLDKLPKDMHTQVVMVQCFSGGFAQMNYVGGDIDTKELSKANRCGFFSQVADRPAAGCSEDINRREEYSPYFFAAYLGKNAKGEKVDADFNKDGLITSDEAHAYVIMKEHSYDIPITTSSQLLRDQDLKIKARQRLSSYKNLVKNFNFADHAIIDTLSDELKVDLTKEDHPLLFIKTRIKTIKKQLDVSRDYVAASEKRYDLARRDVKESLEEDYPVFYNAYSANYGGDYMIGDRPLEKARKAMLEHPQFDAFKEAYLEVQADEGKFEELERSKVKWERMEYLFETKLLEESLKVDAKESVQKRYDELKACEAQSFFE